MHLKILFYQLGPEGNENQVHIKYRNSTIPSRSPRLQLMNENPHDFQPETKIRNYWPNIRVHFLEKKHIRFLTVHKGDHREFGQQNQFKNSYEAPHHKH